jgi:acetate kinase
VATYARPRAWREWGVRRYGFHGISVSWSVERAQALLRRPNLRFVVCHLGGGSSLTAVRGIRSVDTTMGFTPLDGLVMTTRSGSLDPGAIIYLQREHGVGLDELERVLNERSGLRALSGTSGDIRALDSGVALGDHRAKLALDVYVHRIAAGIAAMTASLGGLDALVFTAGVGERSAGVRSAVCRRLGFLGVELDEEANAASRLDADVATAKSRVRVLVVRAREELVIARATRRCVAAVRTRVGA